MTSPPALGVAERLRDDQRQIGGLFDSAAAHQREADHPAAEMQRLTALICTLLRVHDTLVATVLVPALARKVGTDHAVLQQAAQARTHVQHHVDRIEALPVDGADAGAALGELATHVRNHFSDEEAALLTLARQSGLDLDALGAELATRQEMLLSAGGPV